MIRSVAVLSIVVACGGGPTPPPAEPARPAPAPVVGNVEPPPPEPRSSLEPLRFEGPTVPPQDLEKARIAGENEFYPSDTIKTHMALAGKTRLVVPVKLCVDGTTGTITELKLLKSSGYLEYDEAILGGMRQWRYRTFDVGSGTPICTAVTWIYKQDATATPASP